MAARKRAFLAFAALCVLAADAAPARAWISGRALAEEGSLMLAPFMPKGPGVTRPVVLRILPPLPPQTQREPVHSLEASCNTSDCSC